ncbi:MAG: MBL fold metallo-hydrolase [Rhodobacter sp.]|nr:MBL fold metallo-hydrolase [Rhodobacter sp.]
MTLSRRGFIAAGTAAVAAGALTSHRGWAAASLTLGDFQIDTLSDGHLVLPLSFALGETPRADAAPILSRHGLGDGPLEPPCNVTLVRDGTNTVLFDVGSGPDFMPSAGKLMDAFDILGIGPEDVTHVVFTHGHPDHIWGALDDFDDPLFYEAEHMIGQTEFDYWMDDATVDTIDPGRVTFAVGAKRRLEALQDAISTFADGAEILPGIAARATFGHTPGHMSFELAGGAMIVGDAIVNHHLAFERPDWRSGSDQDPDLGAQTRVRLLDQLASDQMTLIGFHLPGGGIGRAEKATEGYRFIAEAL